MKRFAVLAVLLLCLGLLPAYAQKAGTKSTITVEMPGLSCTTTAGTNTVQAAAWSFGASNSTSGGVGGGGGAGKAEISALNVVKSFDECSPKLLGGVLSGKHFASLVLTQAAGKEGVTTVELSEVIIVSFQLSGTELQPEATEAVSFAAAKMCVRQDSGNKICWDLAKNEEF